MVFSSLVFWDERAEGGGGGLVMGEVAGRQGVSLLIKDEL